MQKYPIICLMGPTASGKTQLAIDLVQHYPFAIISVDSALVYRGMDIGTAKPDTSILKRAPHRLIDIRDPAEPYSAAQFRVDALREIADILAQQKIPLLVGGTMLYFSALQKGLSELPAANATLRTQLLEEAKKLGWPEMHKRLAQIDPVAANRIHPHDSQRIQRALEVHAITGKNLTEWHQNKPALPTDYEIHNIGILPEDRSVLHKRIAERFQKMLDDGFLKEVEQLYKRGDLNLEMPSIRSVGYRQAWEYLQGKLTYEEMKEHAIIATRQLAKRQMTWMRSWPKIKIFNSETPDLLQQITSYLMALGYF